MDYDCSNDKGQHCENQVSETYSHQLKQDSPTSTVTCILPEGWIRLRHASGLTIYFHRASRVVSLSRPYAIGSGSLRHHKIPLYAIPCLAYRRKNYSASNCPMPHKSKYEAKLTAPLENGSPDQLPDINESEEQASARWGHSNRATTATNRRKLNLDREEGELTSADEDDDEEVADVHEPDAKKPRLPVVEIAPATHSVVSPAAVDVSVVTVRSFLGKRRRRRRPVSPGSRMVTTSGDVMDQEQAAEGQPPEINNDLTKKDDAGPGERESIKCDIPSYKDLEPDCVLLTHDDVRSYCGHMFQSQKCEGALRRFNEKAPKNLSESVQSTDQLLGLPEDAKVIRYQLPPVEGDPARRQPKEGLINLTGKSYVCILHEYCQNVLRRPPSYQTVVRENERSPYQLTVIIDGQPYATGVGQSKKQARLEAARSALSRLIPGFDKLVENGNQGTGSSNATPVSAVATAGEKELQLFDDIKLSDPRLYELSVRMSLPTPYNLLVECLNRSCVPETELKSSMSSQGRSRHFFTLQLRDHTIKVPCKNKREGRHLAAQLMFGRIHPELISWGAVLRMYGPGSKPDKRGELETIQGAQNREKSAVKTSLIRLLKSKMLELADQWEKNNGTFQPKGKFFVTPDCLPVVTFHPDSKSDLYTSVPTPSSQQ